MRTKAALLAVLLLALGMAAFGWWSTHSQAVFAQLENTLATELTQALGTEVVIGQLQAVGLTTAVINDVIIFDKQGRELAVIKQVTVDYSLLSLARGQTALNALRKVTLTQPVVGLVEDADGIWNIEFLKQETQPDSPVFNGKIVIEQAVLAVNALKGQWQLTAVDGLLTVQDSRAIALKLAASHNDSALSVEGFINTDQNNLSLTIQADSVNPAAYEQLLLTGTPLHFTNGLLTGFDVTIARNAAGLHYAGEFVMDQIAAASGEYTVEKAQGRVSFTTNYVYILGASALVNKQPVAVRGNIGIAGEQPVFDLRVESTGVDLAALSDGFPLAGRVALQADVTGTPASPVVTAELAAPDRVEVAGYSLQDSRARVSYADKIVTIAEFSTQALGGQVRGQGLFDTDTQRYQVQLLASNIDTAAIRDLPVAVSGSGDLTVTAGGQGSNWQSVAGSAVLSLTDGQLEGLPYTRMTALVERTGNTTAIKHYDLILPTGLITAEGTITGDTLAITLDGHGVELAALPVSAGKDLSVSGNAGFTGGLTGTIARPELRLTFQAAGLTVNQQLLGQASGILTASPDLVALEQVTLNDGAVAHELAGQVVLSGAQPVVNLTLVTRSARAETLVRIIKPDLPLTGNLDQEMTISGPLDNLAVHGKLKLSEGSFAGYLIASAEGSYQRENGVITVNDLMIDSLNTRIKLAGTVSADDNLNFSVAAENIDVARLKLEYPYPVSGIFSLTGQVTGTIASPAVNGRLTAGSVLANGQELKDISAELSYEDEQADIRELRFSQGQGSYLFSGAVDIRTHGIDGLFRVEGGELAGILALANVPDRGIRGSLDGEIVLSGSMSNPNIVLRGSIRNGKIKEYLFDTIDIDAELRNKVIAVNTLMAKQGPDGVLAAQGQADLNGQIDMEIGGRAIDTGILTALFNTTLETTGKFSFTAQASGATADPNVSVSMEMQNGSIANAEFDNLYGLLIYNNGSIHVNQLFVARGPYKASAYGIVPLKALNSQGRGKADVTDAMDLNLRLDNADLRILPMLTKEVAWATGPTTGEIAVGGTLSQPTLNGHLTVTNGTVKLKALSDPIQKVGIDIHFKDDKIDISAFDGEMGGGSYSLGGSARINGLTLDDYNLRLTLNRLGVKHKYFAGPIDGAFTVTSKNSRPFIAGKVTVDNATVDIPAMPDSGELPFNAGLDIEVVVGDKVRMYNPYLYDFLAAGKVKIDGSLKRPSASGRVEVRRGTVRYLTNRFTILSGSAEFTQFGSIVPIIRLEAESKFARTRIHLAINGPATAMDLKLTSEPAMSQQEIMSLLTLRGGYFTKNDGSDNDSTFGRDELISLLDAGLQMRFIAEIEGALQDKLGLDEFRLVRSSLFETGSRRARNNQSDQFQGYNLEIGKYLTDKFLISYSVGLDQHNNSVGFRYDLTKNIGLGGSFGGTAKTLLTIETRFAF
ncbi:translocation/assembly module TamB domain-containing protein [Sporomusa termitida]|uniref:TamB, inner membrane protein subunit of TAM complex n=1 Tax=Sporomusa termitida TaxID=2377 RepID=A0A517DXJ9_9FIRM|nr:translocation/assembly module TamB domain-containing protein [Sporomusa termitida]QDR82085.1 TamB, inner membrane protein subunit of TAM complex [Sporomusa termitida]